MFPKIDSAWQGLTSLLTGLGAFAIIDCIFSIKEEPGLDVAAEVTMTSSSMIFSEDLVDKCESICEAGRPSSSSP